MKYSIETTEDGVNETLDVDGNLYKNGFRNYITSDDWY